MLIRAEVDACVANECLPDADSDIGRERGDGANEQRTDVLSVPTSRKEIQVSGESNQLSGQEQTHLPCLQTRLAFANTLNKLVETGSTRAGAVARVMFQSVEGGHLFQRERSLAKHIGLGGTDELVYRPALQNLRRKSADGRRLIRSGGSGGAECRRSLQAAVKVNRDWPPSDIPCCRKVPGGCKKVKVYASPTISLRRFCLESESGATHQALHREVAGMSHHVQITISTSPTPDRKVSDIQTRSEERAVKDAKRRNYVDGRRWARSSAQAIDEGYQ